jgi:uncharacterized membrane protein YhaH (DUF805 family)
MSFTEAVRSVYRNYATFDGRASRSEYWWFQLFYFVVSLGIYVGGLFLAGVARSQAVFGLVLVALIAFVLLSFVPQLAVTVRRLHDSDKSGWWLLLVFIPYIGGFIVFIFTLLDSSIGFNRYGPPYGEMPGDKRVQYWGTTREEAWARFVGDAADAAANGYQPVSQKWIPYVGGQALEVLYRGRPLDPWGGAQIPQSGPPRW